MHGAGEENKKSHPPTDDEQIAEIQRRIKNCLRWMWIRGRRNARKSTIPEWIIAAATFGAFVAASYYAGVAAHQLTAMREATEATRKSANAVEDSVALARKNAHFDERAWIGISYGTYTYTVNQPFGATYEVANTGKTPARKVNGQAVTHFMKTGEVPVFTYEHGTTADLGTVPQGTHQGAISWLIPPNRPKGARTEVMKLGRKLPRSS